MKTLKILQIRPRSIWLLGAFLCLSFPGLAAADTNFGNPAIISELETVKTTLGELGAKLDALAIELDAQGDKLDVHGAKLDLLLLDAESQEKDIAISTNLCFGLSAFSNITLGAHVEGGGGWPNAAWVKLAAQIDARLVGLMGTLGDNICISVPLYKIASDPLAEFNNTEDFDQLIADLVAPSQAVIPLVATLFTAVMPSKDEAMEAMGNVTLAATGFDINNPDAPLLPPNPLALLDPVTLFEPVIEPYEAFLVSIPSIIPAVAADPCGFLANSSLAIDINSVPFCGIAGVIADSLLLHAAFDVVDPLQLLHSH
jgi:hypothetical protein